MMQAPNLGYDAPDKKSGYDMGHESPQLRNFAVWFSLGLAAAYFFVEAKCPSAIVATSTLMMTLARLAAIFACVYASPKEPSVTRFRWYLVALTISLRLVSMLELTFRSPLVEFIRFRSDIPRILMYLGSASLLVAITGSFRREDPRAVKVLDWVTTLLLGTLLFVYVFSVAVHRASAHHSIAMLDIIAAFLAVSATMQWFAAEDAAERRFFYIALVMTWICNGITCLHNHVHSLAILDRSDFGIILPYLVLLCVMLWPTPRLLQAFRPSVRTTRIGRVVGQGLMSLAIVLFSVAIYPLHFFVSIISIVLAVVAFAIRNGLIQNKLMETEEMLRISRQELDAIFLRDSLTGVASRKAFYAAMFNEWRIAARTRSPLSLLLVEIDHFRLLNDTHGRLLGDHCLVHVAIILQRHLARNSDFVARYQGDQFVILLPHTDDQGAMTVAEKIQHAIDQSPNARLGVLKRPITVSIGVSTVQDISLEWDELALIEAAGRGLSEAHVHGRECSRFSDFVSAPHRDGHNLAYIAIEDELVAVDFRRKANIMQ